MICFFLGIWSSITCPSLLSCISSTICISLQKNLWNLYKLQSLNTTRVSCLACFLHHHCMVQQDLQLHFKATWSGLEVVASLSCFWFRDINWLLPSHFNIPSFNNLVMLVGVQVVALDIFHQISPCFSKLYS